MTRRLLLGSRMRGFTLVEIMVGVAIGLIGMLAILRMVSVWDQHTRSATSGDDAQVAGTLAMFALEREVKGAGLGLGLAPPNAAGCNVAAFNAGRVPTTFNFRLRPVEIAIGAGGSPDQLTILTGNSAYFTTEEAFSDGTPATKKARRPNSFHEGDLAVVAGASAGLGTAACAMVQITGRDLLDVRTLQHATGMYFNFYAQTDVPSAPFNDAAGTAPGLTDGLMFNLGPQPRLDLWSIGGPSGTTLQRTDLIANTPPQNVAEGVVNIKAEYGYDFNADQRIADTPAGAEWRTILPVAAPDHPNWTLVRAIRVSFLVRSRQFEKPADVANPVPPTLDLPRWSHGDGTTETFVMTNADGSADSFSGTPNQPDPNNWRYYRYRVYERVIPLRNMIWGVQAP